MNASRVSTSIDPYRSGSVKSATEESTARAAPLASAGGAGGTGGGGDRPPFVFERCRACGFLRMREFLEVPDSVLTAFPLGANGGVVIRRRVPGTDKWEAVECFPPGDAGDDFVPIDPLLSAPIAAIWLGLTLPALYARAPHMASAEKHGNRWFFKRDLFLSVDTPGEHPIPSRRDQLAQREVRRTRGEVHRAGSHADGCHRRHDGPCPTSRRARPSERDRGAVTRSILDELGK